MSKTLTLDGTNLKIDDLFSILEGKQYNVEVDKSFIDKTNNELFVLRKEAKFQSMNEDKYTSLLEKHSNDHGDFLPINIGHMSLYLLLNQSIKFSDVLSPEFIERIKIFINNGIIPCIHSMNFSELSAMNELSLIISGEIDQVCFFNGAYMTIERAIKSIGLNKFVYSVEEVSFLANSCCISTAISIFCLKEAERLGKTADVCVAMNLESIRGEVGAFDKRLHELGRPYRNQIIVAENVRRIINESEYTTEKGRIAYGGDNGPRCQDAICIRAVPQTHGGVRDSIEWLKEILKNELNCVPQKINSILGYATDLTIISLTDLGNISERRSSRLLDTNLSYGLPMNLVGENPGFNHGFPVIQASATAVLGELKLMAMPSSSYSRIDCNSKDYICTTYNSVVKMLTAISLLDKILAIEMLMSAQAMDLVKDKLKDYKFGVGSKVALSEFRRYIKITRENRFAAPDMIEAERIVREELVLKAVEKTIGYLE